MEEYRSLYRKYRPQAPAEVLGQEHVVRALGGAVREGRLAHAFLFSGPRGTGKTSTARILAKMVNCVNGPTAEPCGVCDQCVHIRDGTHMDVVEIDAASHGGVDDARELRERAPTAPAEGREKVYIIDEAQRLTASAFDALLKLFEEPPPGVRFVLATTEPHKMPPTIAGRCQRFEFRRVQADVIAEQLQRIAAKEGLELAATAAAAIARRSDGSVRDALSLLDQASVLGGGTVSDEVVVSLVGAPETEVRFALADAIAVGDARDVFGIVHRLVQEGHDLRHFAAQVTAHFRDLLLALSAPEEPGIVDVPAELHPRLVAQAGKFSAGEIDRILSLLLQAQSDMRWSTAPRLTLELALVRAAMPETDPTPAHAPEASPGPQRRAADESPGGSSSSVGAGPPSKVDAVMLRGSWPRVVEALKTRRKMVLFANAQIATVGSYDGEVLELVFPPGRAFGASKVEEKQADLREVLREVFGITPQIRCTVREGALPEPEPDGEPPATPEDAARLLREQFGAEVVEEAES